MYSFTTSEGTWNLEKRLATNVCGCCKTGTVIAPDGSVYVAFRNIYPGNLRDISLSVSHDGKNFLAPVRVSEDHWALEGCPDDGPTIALDGSGRIHIVWPSFVNDAKPGMRFFHSSTVDGKHFTKRQVINTLGTTKPAHPQIASDGTGGLVLVWDEAQGQTHTVLFLPLTPLPSGNVSEGKLQTISYEQPAMYPVVTPTQGGLIVAWTETAMKSGRSSVKIRRIQYSSSAQKRSSMSRFDSARS
jgi:hypothetical protein